MTVTSHACKGGIVNKDDPGYWAKDGQGIPLCRVCPICRTEKLSRYRPEILSSYLQSDVDEPIEPEEPIERDGTDYGYDY